MSAMAMTSPKTALQGLIPILQLSHSFCFIFHNAPSALGRDLVVVDADMTLGLSTYSHLF